MSRDYVRPDCRMHDNVPELPVPAQNSQKAKRSVSGVAVTPSSPCSRFSPPSPRCSRAGCAAAIRLFRYKPLLSAYEMPYARGCIHAPENGADDVRGARRSGPFRPSAPRGCRRQGRCRYRGVAPTLTVLTRPLGRSTARPSAPSKHAELRSRFLSDFRDFEEAY
jgi:hypothetical protein